MKCVKPNLSISSCSDVRQQDEMLVTVSFAVKGRTAFLVSFSSCPVWVSITLDPA